METVSHKRLMRNEVSPAMSAASVYCFQVSLRKFRISVKSIDAMELRSGAKANGKLESADTVTRIRARRQFGRRL